jgi:flagellar biogenesis protein FliO
VVTVEVGQGVDRVWLVLGVANESVQCLHKMAPTPQPQPQPGLGTVNAKA